MKHTLAVFPGNFLPHLGGLETHVDGLVATLAKNHHKHYDVIVCAPQLKGMEALEMIHDTVTVYRYPAFEIIKDYPVPKFWTRTFWKTLRKVSAHKPSIIMTRTMWFTNTLVGTLYSLGSKKRKLIHVEHASDFTPHNWFVSFVNKLYMRIFGAFTLRKAKKIVAVSQGAKTFLTTQFPFTKNKKIPIIRRGYDYKTIYSAKSDYTLRKKYKDNKLLLYVGRLIDGKGVQDLVNALIRIPKDTILLVVGSGAYQQTLQKQARKLGVSNRIVFMGAQPREKVYSMLKVVDCFVNPSYAEGLPTSVLEACFAGASVVATNVGGTTEILDGEWNTTNKYQLVPPKDVGALADAINAALKQNLNTKRSTLATLEKKFNWKAHAKKYDTVFKEVLK